jgi:signal transduction histidine kinase
MQDLFSEENQIITIVIIGVLMLLLMALALLLFFFFSRKKIVQKELEKKMLVINHQKETIQAIIVTQEEERTRIAQDLHDDISSKLNVINLNANLLKDGNLNPEEYGFVNNNILEATDKTLESARRIAHNLLPPILNKFGLKPAIEELSDDFNNSKKVLINYVIEYPEDHLSKENELHFFRIIQELINNSIRHGKAKKISILFTFENESLFFKYTDNGIGFDIEKAKLKKGLGTHNIESRAELLKSVLTIKSAINKGVEITIKR